MDATCADIAEEQSYNWFINVGTNKRNDANTIKHDRDIKCNQNSIVFISFFNIDIDDNDDDELLELLELDVGLAVAVVAAVVSAAVPTDCCCFCSWFLLIVNLPKWYNKHNGIICNIVDTPKIILHGCWILFFRFWFVSNRYNRLPKILNEFVLPSLAPDAK